LITLLYSVTMATLVFDTDKAQFELTIDGEKETEVYGMNHAISAEAHVWFSAVLFGSSNEFESLPVETGCAVRLAGPCVVSDNGVMKGADDVEDVVSHRVYFKDGRQLSMNIIISSTPFPHEEESTDQLPSS
jgi:hypothetical protein